MLTQASTIHKYSLSMTSWFYQIILLEWESFDGSDGHQTLTFNGNISIIPYICLMVNQHHHYDRVLPSRWTPIRSNNSNPIGRINDKSMVLTTIGFSSMGFSHRKLIPLIPMDLSKLYLSKRIIGLTLRQI